jgi:UDP-N-acetylmuramoyl-L-alanyl-D-glutamate--2,6-diaminopimelate ligase
MATSTSSTLALVARSAGDLVIRIDGDPATKLSGVAYDSRVVKPGDLFFCIPGATVDGHAFAHTAAQAGAAALCVERSTHAGIPEIIVRSVRKAMPLMAAEACGYPARQLLLLGITGTNGKTTTTYLLDSILRADGRTTGLIGTIETRIAGEVRPGIRTTPESVDVQLLFTEMLAKGVGAVAMEVTSHALVQGRVDGMRFASVGFTNLTQDHLDFHTDMEDYFSAKSLLFTAERTERGAVNMDDPYGQRIKELSDVPVLGYGRSGDAEVRAVDVHLNPSGSTFRAVTPKGEMDVTTSLVGPFNISNCLGAIAVALQADIDPEAIEAGIRSLAAVPGRFESVHLGQPFAVVVDYAHTPDSLDNVLVAARRIAAAGQGRVICVFGCGGDRDKGKRPLMGIVAAKRADYVVVTSDNPRSENPSAIVGEILLGIGSVRAEGPDAALVDRRDAIAHALAQALPGDVVIIAGKGHETGQQFADRTVAFDDREVARELLAGARRGATT